MNILGNVIIKIKLKVAHVYISKTVKCLHVLDESSGGGRFCPVDKRSDELAAAS